MEEVNYVPTVQEVKDYAPKEAGNASIMDAASQELSEQDVKNLEQLRDAKVSTAVTGSSLSSNGITKEQLMKMMPRKVQQQVRKYNKIGRNDPCPCGAVDENGKPMKYKNCCLKTGKYEGLKSFKQGKTKNPYMKEAA